MLLWDGAQLPLHLPMSLKPMGGAFPLEHLLPTLTSPEMQTPSRKAFPTPHELKILPGEERGLQYRAHCVVPTPSLLTLSFPPCHRRW